MAGSETRLQARNHCSAQYLDSPPPTPDLAVPCYFRATAAVSYATLPEL